MRSHICQHYLVAYSSIIVANHNLSNHDTVAIADIPPDTILFTIPRASIVSKDTSTLATTKLPALFADDGIITADDDGDHDMTDDDETGRPAQPQDAWTTLILILIHEHLHGATSPWKAYLDVLPRGPEDFSTPMFWDTAELAELQASPVASKVGRGEAERMIRRQILPAVRAHEDVFFPPGESKLDDEALVALAFRMGSVIMAYAFDLENEDEEGTVNGNGEGDEDDEWVEDREGRTTLGMVPMADILNADAAFNAHIEHGTDALVATTLRPIAKGEEILNYYGPLSSGELLRRYGYVTDAHKRWDLVDMSWEAVIDALRAQLVGLGGALGETEWDTLMGALAEEADDMEEGFVIERGAGDPDSEGRVEPVAGTADVPEELVAQLKQVMKLVKKVRAEAVPDKVVRDRVIYSAIVKALEDRAGQYSTTLEQDLELAEKGKQNGQKALDRKRMALDVRLGEKRLLKEAIEAARNRLNALVVAARDGDGRSAKRRRI